MQACLLVMLGVALLVQTACAVSTPSPSPTVASSPATPFLSAPTSTPAPAPTATLDLDSDLGPTPTITRLGFGFVKVQGAPPGGNARVEVHTLPRSSCSLAYRPPSSLASAAQPLGTRVADSSGRITWVWQISPLTHPGTGQVSVTCNGFTGTEQILIGRGG